MRIVIAALLLSSSLASSALSAEIRALSRIDAVTVYPQGAEVVRIAEAAVETGETTLVFEGLPGDLQAETLRIEGTSPARIDIGSVDSRLVTVTGAAANQARGRIEAEIEGLQDERAALDQSIADAEVQRQLMQQLASDALARKPEEGETRILGAQELGDLLDLVGSRLGALSKIVLEARNRQRDLDRRVAELTVKLNEAAPREDARMTVAVHLSARAAAAGTFTLRYRVANAGWRPIYDARLTWPEKGGSAVMELVRRADVTQSTAESWDRVALTLSTARPVGATAAPDLMPLGIEQFEEGRARNYSRSDSLTSLDDAQAAPGAVARSVAQLEAETVVAGFQALYGIPGRVSIGNTGTAKKVRIATDRIDSTLSARAVPKLDPNAYLTAAFTLKGDTPLLPGAVMLYRDGVYMGQGALPLLSPGEEHRLGFGADDLIKVKRVEVGRSRGEEGLIATSNVDTRAYDITVKNLHGFAMPVTVLDQVPVSSNAEVEVDMLPGMTPATETDAEKKRGVLAWTLDLAPAAEGEIKHGYKVTWPVDLKVGIN